MSDVSIYKGGLPVINYMWCEGDYPQYTPPFYGINQLGTPPYDSHACGTYNLGYFTLGMPIRPALMSYQRNAMVAGSLEVGDIIRCIVIPVDHYVTYLNFKIVEEDTRLAGASVELTAQTVIKNAKDEYVFTEVDNIEKAAIAQGYATPISLATKSNTMISLLNVVTSGTPAVSYVRPLYATPDTVIIIGIKIASLPTAAAVKIEDALNGWYLSVKTECFECPTQL